MKKRNYGFGRSLEYAAKRALQDYIGERYGTIASHINRFRLFGVFCKINNTTNAVYITIELLESYSTQLQNKVLLGEISVAYAHNLVSSINVVMKAFRRDKSIWLSPKTLFGPRCHIRQVAPNLSLVALKNACKKIREIAGPEIALIVLLSRLIGLRLKESILLDAKKALKQALTTGFVDVRRGTKGGRGRKVERLVKVNKRIIWALKMAVEVQRDRNTFIPSNEKLITFYRRIHRCALPILKQFDIRNIQEQRSSYACVRYNSILGWQAPVIRGIKEIKTEEVREARRQISYELGHTREYVLDSYCGS